MLEAGDLPLITYPTIKTASICVYAYFYQGFHEPKTVVLYMYMKTGFIDLHNERKCM